MIVFALPTPSSIARLVIANNDVMGRNHAFVNQRKYFLVRTAIGSYVCYEQIRVG